MHQFMTNFIIIFTALILGFLCKRIERFPRSTGLSLNLFVVYVSLPALILSRFPNLLQTIDLQGHWWLPVGMAWATFLISWLIITRLSKKYGWSPAKTGALILTIGLGNTSFVGFPLLEALLGREAIQIGILADQPGSFLVLSTLGVLIAARYGGFETSAKAMFKRVILFPPFLAMLAAVFWTLVGLPGWDVLHDPLDKISMSLVPVALFSVGFQLQLSREMLMRRRFPLILGLSLKLVMMPLIFYTLIYKIFGLSDLFAHVTVLESAMATQITSAVVANEFNLDVELANLMVALSILLSLITVPLWHYLVLT